MFDQRHKYTPGTIQASHAELKLVLWFSCNLAQKHFGIIEADRDPLGDLWQLLDIEETIEAEVVLSEALCPTCKKFIEFFERIHKRV